MSAAFEAEIVYSRLEYEGMTPKGGRSHKFYEAIWGANQNNVSFVVYRWGKVGSWGQSQMKTGPDALPGSVRDKLSEKVSKGYDYTHRERTLAVPLGSVDYAVRHGDADKVISAARAALDSPFGRHPELEQEQATWDDPEPATTNGHTSLSERALTLLSKAAVSPNEVLSEYAVLAEEVQKERDKVTEAERAIRTLEVMLGIDDEG